MCTDIPQLILFPIIQHHLHCYGYHHYTIILIITLCEYVIHKYTNIYIHVIYISYACKPSENLCTSICAKITFCERN